ncbi:MAG: alkaline phosphatase family protein [Pirellulales bacterium]|nr:alkaline phosphatase family protein [Pirellulales bacterium]
MKFHSFPWLLSIIIALSFCREISTTAADHPTKTKYVLWVMLDGLRWQEVFHGADEGLINKDRGGVEKPDQVKAEFLRGTPAESRAALLPFLWTEVAKKGQIYGNQWEESVATVTNKELFSYPGYNEVLCGFADHKITSNDKNYNNNVTVLEWLHAKPEFAGRIAAFTSWEVFPYIINDRRSGIMVNGGLAPLTGITETAEVRLLNRLMAETPLYADETRPDALTFHAARLYLAAKKPRVLFVSFDETDAQGHAGRYDRVLGGAKKNDAFIRELWELAQSLPEYRDQTTLVITTDHGRGDPPVEWKNHNKNTPGSENIWLAVMGPDTRPLGERQKVAPVTQSQVAATVAALLGYDYRAYVPQAGEAIREVLGK